MASPLRPRILLVCTANICRSPMAAALLTCRLREAGVEAKVASAGLFPSRLPAHPLAVDALAARGIDLRDHRPRGVEREDLEQADLVIGMTREHVRELVTREPAAWCRAFTLKELVRRALAAGLRPEGTTLAEWIARLHEGRETPSLLGSSPEDDISDPIGGAAAAFEATSAEIAGLVDALVAALWPTHARP